MQKNSEAQNNFKGFPDLINYFGFVDEGILLNKDGSLMAGFYYHGPDLDSSSAQDKDALCSQVNAVLGSLRTGWVINVNAIRIPVTEYPHDNSFPDATSWLIDCERKSNFESAQRHFETVYVLTLTYKPSALQDRKFQKLFVTSEKKNKIDAVKQRDMESLCREFKQVILEVESGLSGARLNVEQMSSTQMQGFLHYCITARYIDFADVQGGFLNYLLGGYDFTGGIHPQIDGKYIGVVAVVGFPSESHSEMLGNALMSLPFEYRFSIRFIVLDPVDAEQEIKKVLLKWHNKQFNLKNIILQIISPGSESQYGNIEAAEKAADAHQAMTIAQAGGVRYGYFSSVIVIICEDESECQRRVKIVRDLLTDKRFPARVETINAIEAYLGSLPGDSARNVRKPLIHTLNMTHLMPLAGTWTGQEYNPNPRLEKNSPSLFYASTQGAAPFRFNNYVDDVGHTMICGPTGSGKSTLLSLMCVQFLRYPGAQVFCFDKRNSMFALVKACSARHYPILDDDSHLTFSPLKDIAVESEKRWACEWMEELIVLAGVEMNPEKRIAISNAINALRSDKEKTLSNFCLNIQNTEIRKALDPFVSTQKGVMAHLLDASHDSLQDGHFQVFEISKLMEEEKRFSIPVLSYLFHQIERRLSGAPTLIAVDEAWTVFDDQMFREKLKIWLRELRKANACVVFCTQHVTDIIHSSIKDVILESCPVKVYLPNPQAASPTGEEAYKTLGLNETQIGIIANAIAKKHYYYTSPLGMRLIDLELEKAFLSFMGKTSLEDIKRIKSLEQKHGEAWVKYWLSEYGLNEEAGLWDEVYESLTNRRG